MTNQEAINEICDMVNALQIMHESKQGQALQMAIKALENQKTGHWEPYRYFWEDKFKCSECGKEQPKILCEEQIIGHWSDYCPNCGANMLEEEE